MKRRMLQTIALSLLCATLLALMASSLARAQSTVSGKLILYVDERTGQVFIRPGRHRVRLVAPGGMSSEELDKAVEQKVQERTQALQNTIAQQQAVNASLAAQTQQLAEMKPAWKSYADGFASKMSIGTLLYGDYAFYTHPGFGPQFLENQNQPGPGNELFNSFEITRVYTNLLYTPTDDWTFRFTPELYRTIGSSNDRFGRQGGIGSNLDGNLAVRLKYAYLQYNKLFDNVPQLKGHYVKLGVMTNPFIPWEEDLTGYRFVYLPPWNYVGLSSSQAGLSIGGPLKIFGGEKTYADYETGIFNNATFRAFEQSNTKQWMGRLSIYPFGALWRFDGLGITGFYDYAYGNTTPDLANVPAALKGPQAYISRVAALLHYTTESWQLAGEYDRGRNAFSAANFFSGSGPGDFFGFNTCTATGGNCTSLTGATVNNTATITYPGQSDFALLTQALLNNGRSEQQGFDFFGHYTIPTTPLTIFGIYQWFFPNLKVDQNPLDFERFVVGVSYQYNEYLRFALDSQNLLFYHSQFPFPLQKLLQFNPSAVSTCMATGTCPRSTITSTSPVIRGIVPHDMHALFLNVEFSY